MYSYVPIGSCSQEAQDSQETAKICVVNSSKKKNPELFAYNLYFVIHILYLLCIS